MRSFRGFSVLFHPDVRLLAAHVELLYKNVLLGLCPQGGEGEEGRALFAWNLKALDTLVSAPVTTEGGADLFSQLDANVSP